MMKTINIVAKDVQLMLEDEKLGEAMASISLNPNVTWLKMVVNDDKPNANGMMIPKEEFINVIKTAVYMPLKMALGKISEDHIDTFPIGSIAHLINKEDHIEALAALWNKERPEDIQLLKDRHENGQSIDVSWELNYDIAASTKNKKGILELRNVEMNAVTIVGLPSYMGRTNVTALASKEGDAEIMDTINREDHDKIVKGLNETIEGLKDELKTASTKTDELTASVEELAPLKIELEELKPKFDELKKFKEDADATKEKEEKVAGIRKKFEEAGLEINDEYFAEREETLLGMEEAALDFFIQELLVFKSEKSDKDDGTADASLSITSKVPDIKRETKKKLEKDDLLAHLKELDNPKE